MGSTPVIGLEIHAQLRTGAKMFCSCPVRRGLAPNASVCPVCAGLPGAMPTVNGAAVEQATRAALALGAEVHALSRFVRKSYFYPDLPKGYQITQHDQPLATGGFIRAELPSTGADVRIRLQRLHLEEDSGKSLTRPTGRLVDLNRAGVPLAEVVTEPDISSPEEAVACLRALRTLLMALGVCDGDMEAGSLRCDANVSTFPGPGDSRTSERVELKNLNSFKHLRDALGYEARRQAEVIQQGGRVGRETRAWSPLQRLTRLVRHKEGASDYRYLPEPDLPPLRLVSTRIEELREALPELPRSRAARYLRDMELPRADASSLASHPAVAAYFEALADAVGNPRRAAAFVRNEILPRSRVTGSGVSFFVPADRVAELLRLVEGGRLGAGPARSVLEEMAATGGDAETIVTELGLGLRHDDGALAATCRKVVDEHPTEVARYRAGKEALMELFVGRVMRASRGRLRPEEVRRTLSELLRGPMPMGGGATGPDDERAEEMGSGFEPIEWRDGTVVMLDQRELPAREVYNEYRSIPEVAEAIENLVIRGAPAIGFAGAMGLALAARLASADGAHAVRAAVAEASETLAATRPTAVNLAWALGRMQRVLAEAPAQTSGEGLTAVLVDEAIRIKEEDAAASRRMGELGAALLPNKCNVLTHCNTGALATGAHGTALGVIRSAVEQGKRIRVFADETRPLLQGARLTAWELARDGIDVTLIPDSAAGAMMQEGRIDVAVVGADRIAANGDVANKSRPPPAAPSPSRSARARRSPPFAAWSWRPRTCGSETLPSTSPLPSTWRASSPRRASLERRTRRA